jgi:bis(5'-nucleosyl)-tetraphosphatase (symmetrical)
MATYVIGDVQGCFDSLNALLKTINFSPENDRLWFTGDAVNRGPKSLATLQFIKSLGPSHKLVLGNHDLGLLAVACGVRKQRPVNTTNDILQSPQCDELIDWLRQQPVFYAEDDWLLMHAGIAPGWTLDMAKCLAEEVHHALRGDHYAQALQQIFGEKKESAPWSNNLKGGERLRFIVDAFTRIRFCFPDGGLNFTQTNAVPDEPGTLIPWFHLLDNSFSQKKLLFGHWASLNGKVDVPHVFGLDTGCAWKDRLTALCLETNERISVKACDEPF